MKLGQNVIKKVDNLIHLGMPIGDRKFVEHFFCQKFRNVEKSYYSLYGMGCRPDGLNYYTSADIYKKFCQSSFYYGLETNYISKTTLNYLNIRQNILIKNSFGLNKFTRTTPLLDAINVKSMHHLYDRYQLTFYKQVMRNTSKKQLYEALKEEYSNKKKPRESYISILENICNKL